MNVFEALDKYRVVRRLILLWACWLITFSVMRVFNNLELVNGAVATALTTVVGILTVVVGFYQKGREKDDARNS